MSDKLSLGDLGYPTVDTVRRAQAYHDILADLIAELRMLNSELDAPPLYDAASRAETRMLRVSQKGNNV